MPHMMRAALAVCGVALVGLALLLSAGLSYRLGLLSLPGAFGLLRWGAYLAVAGMIAAGVAGVFAYRRRRWYVLALLSVAFVLSTVAFAIPYQWQRTARAVPPIHDITTDLEHPPAFTATVVRVRGEAANPLEHREEVGAQQKQAYPDIAPVTLPSPARRRLRRRAAGGAGDGLGDPHGRPDRGPHRGHRHHTLVRVPGRRVRAAHAVGLGDARRRAFGVARRTERRRHQRPPHPPLSRPAAATLSGVRVGDLFTSSEPRATGMIRGRPRQEASGQQTSVRQSAGSGRSAGSVKYVSHGAPPGRTPFVSIHRSMAA
jgi:hypothetical protein